jgi:hypothetical protein
LVVQLCNDTELREKLSASQKELSASFWSWRERMEVEVSELEKLVASRSHANSESHPHVE